MHASLFTYLLLPYIIGAKRTGKRVLPANAVPYTGLVQGVYDSMVCINNTDITIDDTVTKLCCRVEHQFQKELEVYYDEGSRRCQSTGWGARVNKETMHACCEHLGRWSISWPESDQNGSEQGSGYSWRSR
ncbi:hypothetical protein BT63DRAFT_451550 [Microthyrium microscopicum]|uniref:Uncharacterized protein n=1 Tax=Microthyrium microscopicum TaxID=703497 RepID=A0A6A6UMN7_9PEZI|nr:hypothetical protein BT63DRAFT_451550 [Microthyrium microscopicum]